MPSSHTTNYQLSQWERTDKIQMEDFNADNEKIDAALGTLAETAAAHTAQLSKLGNCILHFTSYTGTGGDVPRSVTFPKKPVFVCVMSKMNGYFVPIIRGNTSAVIYTSTNGMSAKITWSGNTVSWQHHSLNDVGYTYYVFALMDAAE